GARGAERRLAQEPRHGPERRARRARRPARSAHRRVEKGRALRGARHRGARRHLAARAGRDRDLAGENLRLESCREALADLAAIQNTFRQHQSTLYPEFPVAEKLLARAQALLGEALGFESDAGGAPAPAAEAEGSGDGAPGKLKTRADARRMLESVCDFLERTEPAHPAPILIRRAARLLDLSFVDIIRDLAP